MKKITAVFISMALLSSNVYTADLETTLEKQDNTSYLNNITLYGAGEKVSDTSYKGLGIKYDSDYTEVVFEKGDDYKRASLVQRIDIDNMFYTKLGLGYLSREEMILGNIKDITQTTLGGALGYGNDTSYNIEFGYIANKLSNAGLANTTTKIWYTELIGKYDMSEFGKIDGSLSYQNAEAYGKSVSDYTASVGYYPIDDLKFGVKYDSIEYDDDNYRITAGLNYKYDWDKFSEGTFSPTVMFTRNVSENVIATIEYKEGIANRSLKMRDKFEEQINTTEIIAKKINPEEFEKRTTATPAATWNAATIASGASIIDNNDATRVIIDLSTVSSNATSFTLVSVSGANGDQAAWDASTSISGTNLVLNNLQTNDPNGSQVISAVVRATNANGSSDATITWTFTDVQ